MHVHCALDSAYLAFHFKVAHSPYFEEMVCAFNDGPTGYKPPSYEKLRTMLVVKEKAHLEKAGVAMKMSWSVDGSSIIDGWLDSRSKMTHH